MKNKKQLNQKIMNVFYFGTGILLSGLFYASCTLINQSYAWESKQMPLLLSPVPGKYLYLSLPEEQTATHAAIVAKEKKAENIADIIYRVGKLESNLGKTGLAKTCASKGMFNWYGYAAYNGFCFKTEKEMNNTMIDWFTRHLEEEKMELSSVLCHYNLGYTVNDCQYYQNFKAL